MIHLALPSVSPSTMTILAIAGLTVALGRLLPLLLRRGLTLHRDSSYAHFIPAVLTFAIYLIGASTVLAKIGLNVTAIFSLGTLGLTLSLGLQQLTANAVNGAQIIGEGDIRLGTWVSVNGETGQVIDQGIRKTTLRGSNGNLVYVPNSTMATAIVTALSTASVQALVSAPSDGADTPPAAP